jgi:formate C-acetyltransferase
VLKLDTGLFMGDSSVDLSFDPNAVRGQEGLDAMRALLMTYVDHGGHALQINVLSAEQLRRAQQEPEKYQDLQIRVCGWNVFWNSLKKEEQDFFIRQAMAN